MEQSIGRARKFSGELIVPGELGPAQRCVMLAAVSNGTSHIANAPAGTRLLVDTLKRLGLEAHLDARSICIRGAGLRGLRATEELLDLRNLRGVRQILLGVLAAQPFATRVHLGKVAESEERLLEYLQGMGASVTREDAGTLSLHGRNGLHGRDHHVDQLPGTARLGLALAGLGADGTTALLESAGGRSRIERLLRERELTVDCRREQNGERFRLAVSGGDNLGPLDAELPGDLNLAYPFMIMAVARRSSRVRLPHLTLRSQKRGLLDLLRQIGAEIELTGPDGDAVDITVSHSKGIKATRVAGQRASRVLPQIGLLAILATQCPGEFVIRDIQQLRSGPVDQVAHICVLLKSLGARVGEYPEGLVVQGGSPLGGAALDCLGDPGLAFACTAAGVLAHGDSVISGVECLDPVFPDFFTALDSIKE